MSIVEPVLPNPEDLRYHAESRGLVLGSAERVFAHLDDHARLAAHMNRHSWRTGWSRMTLSFDEQKGRALGSHIRFAGCMLGVPLSLEEVVTEYAPPKRKVWITVGTPWLLVIGRYRMGFELVPANDAGVASVALTVFIDYALPDRGVSWLLGRMLGGGYARWCTQRMVADARAAFARVDSVPPGSNSKETRR